MFLFFIFFKAGEFDSLVLIFKVFYLYSILSSGTNSNCFVDD